MKCRQTRSYGVLGIPRVARKVYSGESIHIVTNRMAASYTAQKYNISGIICGRKYLQFWMYSLIFSCITFPISYSTVVTV